MSSVRFDSQDPYVQDLLREIFACGDPRGQEVTIAEGFERISSSQVRRSGLDPTIFLLIAEHDEYLATQAIDDLKFKITSSREKIVDWRFQLNHTQNNPIQCKMLQEKIDEAEVKIAEQQSQIQEQIQIRNSSRGLLSHEEAMFGLALFLMHSDVMTELLKPWEEGRNRYVREAVFYNLNDVSRETQWSMEETHPVYFQHPANLEVLLGRGFTPDQLAGIFFKEENVGDARKEWGSSVIKLDSGGSGVIVSVEGHVMTAAHVVLDATNNLHPKISFSIGGKNYSFRDVDVVMDMERDVALVKIPELVKPIHDGDVAYARIAMEKPVTGEFLTAVGYPVSQYEAKNQDERGRKLYSVGSYAGTTYMNQNNLKGVYHTTSVRPYRGQSGGAFFNSKGELVGITSYVTTIAGQAKSSQAAPIEFVFGNPGYNEMLKEVLNLQVQRLP